MKLSKLSIFASAYAAALVLSLAPLSAATVDFAAGTAAGGTVAGGPSYTTSALATGILNGGGAVVTKTVNGLGVNGMPDSNPNQIDGSPIGSAETLTITFSWAVKLLSISMGLIDSNDDMEWSVNNGSWTTVGSTIPASILIGLNNVTSFSVRAKGTFWQDGFILGNDDFTLKSANISPVPLPAAGLLLVAGLGGLAALRRKRKAA
ncbi:MAG: sorting protein [Cypionkella sp.]|uniref:VPLPA-CTERM sorting domain-containing protein n=1 Tax=Cypionkella sp. TaxID=2811411 RepID=UPI0026048174|nr:VPLPA-CTERM sorting domain-containing protein [Cypionkella sp.]MDB5661594.1 sorting protein [Cypionkella sp.]